MDVYKVRELKDQFTEMADKYISLINEHEELQKELQTQMSLNSIESISTKKDKEAVLFLSADVSGSMGRWEKDSGQKLAELLKVNLTNAYKHVSVRYFHHHTESKEVTESEFLGRGESGGTLASTVYRQMNKELEDHPYENENTDVFVVHLSDGDNLTSDCTKSKTIIDKITSKANLFLYFELNQYNRHSSLNSKVFKQNVNTQVLSYIIENTEDIQRETVRALAEMLG